MKIIFLLFVLAFSIQVNGQIKGNTQVGRIIQKIDKTPPVISLTEPAVTEGSNYAAPEGKITIKGNIKDDSDIKSLLINNAVVTLPSNGEFSAEILLKDGVNLITIKAADKNDNLSVLNFTATYQSDKTGPLLYVISPVLDNKRTWLTDNKLITIKIKAEDESGVNEVRLNDKPVIFLQNSGYEAAVTLNEGINTYKITAADKNNNISEYNFAITYKSDITGPIVKITEPEVTRGIKIVRKSEVVAVKGLATDASGVFEVTVNNLRTVLSAKGEFSVNMHLQPGDNLIVVKATDNKYNTTVDTFYITRNVDEMISAGKFYALIIGIDKYQGIWPSLKNAVNDAKGVEDVLRYDYKFDEIITLYNEKASRSNIITEFENLSAMVTKNDNVLIFYSGHGEFNQQFNKGYWVPVNAATRSTADYISNSDIQTYMNGIQSKHTILISDACFSGDIFRGGKTEQLPFEDSERYFKEVYRRASRYALTSGGIEPVTDGGREGHSVFTYYLLKALKENNSKYFTAGQLFKEIEIPVANNSEQTPIYQPIKNIGDEGGQFIFVKK